MDANPIKEDRQFAYQGKVIHDSVEKMRAMTFGGLCIFLDIDDDTWTNYKKRKDFFGVVTRVERIIRTQKFEGAAAELLNANIIARDLGLADKSEHSRQGVVIAKEAADL